MISTLNGLYAKAGIYLSGNKGNKRENLAISILFKKVQCTKPGYFCGEPKATLRRSWDDATLDKGDTVLKIPLPGEYGR